MNSNTKLSRNEEQFKYKQMDFCYLLCNYIKVSIPRFEPSFTTFISSVFKLFECMVKLGCVKSFGLKSYDNYAKVAKN